MPNDTLKNAKIDSTLPGISAVDLSAAPGGLSPAGSISGVTLRAAVYVDGFNFYHALDDLNTPHVKWVDLWRLSTVLAGTHQKVVRVVWCSAPPKDPARLIRHRKYRAALATTGVEYIEGHFVQDGIKCVHCGKYHYKPLEKQGDINVAIELIADGFADIYDIAYLVSADSDQAATARLFRARLANGAKPKRLITVAPPGRQHSHMVFQQADGKRAIYAQTAEACVFGGFVKDPNGGKPIVRPTEYDPPSGWIRPAVKVIV
mgnify:CR=1 FL=1